MTKIYTIDASGKKLGRIAVEAAHQVMGKSDPNFTKNKIVDVSVHITNASQLDLPEKKQGQKRYRRYSGYPSGLKEESLSNVIAKKGVREAVRRAVYNMLPHNKLRTERMKRIVIEE
jgi:large subunit ribosomal protein L13